MTNTLKFQGKIKHISPMQSGISSRTNQPWRSMDFVVEEADGQYPQSVVCRTRNEAVIALLQAQRVDSDGTYNGLWLASIDLKAHSFQKADGTTAWSTDLNCWKLERIGD